MIIETNIYKCIINKFLENKITPHIISFINIKQIHNFENMMKNDKSPIMKQIQKQATVIKQKDYLYDLDTATFLLLELGSGYELGSIYSKLTPVDIKIVIFQTLYTLYNFALIGLLHNDLHLGNIMIDILDKPATFIYFTDENTYYSIETKYMAKIFDFDFSYYCNKVMDEKNCQKNTKLFDLKEDGVENNKIIIDKNDKFDLFTFLCLLYDYISYDKGTRTLIERIIKANKLLTYKWKYNCRLSNKTYKEKNPGASISKEGTYFPTSEQIINFSDIFGGDMFKQYKHFLSKEGFPYPIDYCHIYMLASINREPILYKIKEIK